MTVDWTLLLLISALGYFLGSVPCGVIIAKFAGVHDLMSRGSGNIGATNAVSYTHLDVYKRQFHRDSF